MSDIVMVNYNMENPEERGFWFDAKVTELKEHSRTNKEVYAKILLGYVIAHFITNFNSCFS